jgi:ribosomal protein L34
MREEQREMRDQLSLQRLESTLTPSQASTAKETYDRLLDDMHLSVFCEKEIVKKLEGDTRPEFKFQWGAANEEAEKAVSAVTNADSLSAAVQVEEEFEVPEDAPEPHRASSSEKLSYTPLCKYLRSIGKQAYVIANGYNVGSSRGLLFNRRAHGMRLKHPTEKGQFVASSIRVKGRSDLAVLKEKCGAAIGNDLDFKPTSKLGRNSVAWVIEVKELIIGDGACREAITQLIGLNMENSYTSPKVLLTNLIGTHHVYYIKCEDSFPWYSIQWRRCSTLLAAIQFIERLDAEPRSEMAYHFGRATSPTDEDD